MSDRLQHRSRALATVVDRLSSLPAPAVLDLGPALSMNIGAFASFGGRLTVADLRGEIVGGRGPLTQALELEPAGDSTYDLILAWDLFDYLPAEHALTLGRRLAALSRAGTQLLCFVNYHGTMPTAPRIYRVREDVVYYEETGEGTRTSPRLEETQLLRVVSGYETESGLLLQNGLKELLMVCRPAEGRE